MVVARYRCHSGFGSTLLVLSIRGWPGKYTFPAKCPTKLLRTFSDVLKYYVSLTARHVVLGDLLLDKSAQLNVLRVLILRYLFRRRYIR